MEATESSRKLTTDHVAPSIRKGLALTSLTSGGRSVGIVRLRTVTTEFLLCKPVPKTFVQVQTTRFCSNQN
jgi:hypothetical protein